MSDSSHQASTDSPAGVAAGSRVRTAPSSPPHAPSATQQSAVTLGHGDTRRDDTAQDGSALEQGLGQQLPGLRASLALDSLREVAAGQRHGRLTTPRTSLEGALGDQAQPHDADAAAQTADGLHAKSCCTGSEGVARQSGGGEEADSVEKPRAQHVAGAAAGSGGADGEAATEETPASPVRPARPAHSPPSGNPFAGPVPAEKQPSRLTPESGAPPEDDASSLGHGVEALRTAESEALPEGDASAHERGMATIRTGLAGLGLAEVPEARAVTTAESPAGGGTPAAKRGRFAPR